MTTDQPDLADLIKARGKVMHIQPSDVLILSNVSGVDPQAHGNALTRLKDDIGVAKLYIFDEDIDVTVLRSTPAGALFALDRIYLMGDEDCGVGVGCMDCYRGGLPIAYYTRYGAAYEDDETVAKADTIAGLLAAAIEHRRTVHPEAA